MRLALRRLSLRRQNNLSERRFFEEERRRGVGLPDAAGQGSIMTPSESIMSLGNLHLWASRGPYLPDKLQIVKPLEGEGGAKKERESRRRRRREESRLGQTPEGERAGGWAWVRKTGAGLERERGRRWASDKAGSRKRKAASEGKATPPSLMLFNSFWSLMRHHKSGVFASPHTFCRDTQPRAWL